MTKRPRNTVEQLRGASRLAIEAITRVVDLVEAMQHVVGGGPAILGRPLLAPTRVLSAPVYASVRGVTRMVGATLDLALARLASMPGIPEREHDTVLAVLNGVLGDHLEESGNPLAIEMRLRRDGRALELERAALRAAYPDASRKLLVLAHGSCRHDRQWSLPGPDQLAALARELGFTPVHLHYNTGLHVATNGRALAALLERLAGAWPAPVDELAIVGHSMGGLVARSACYVGEAEGHAWRRTLRKLVCIASPHHGAPLERGGHWIDVLLEVSRYSAPLARLGKLRSAGVTDLRFGNVLDEHRDARGRFAPGGDVRRELKLPEGVRCYAIAGTRTPRPGGRLSSDGLVPVDSALGRHRNPRLTLAFTDTWLGFGMSHVAMLSRPELHAVLRSWLSS
ncbi:triacylglycerol lipase [Anaeromyxobacter sp. Fw109-5]|uniref:esterase/lipase family protein n=1 Tax=Anaeromyxobacter sp. (strain Fw109-5) TaxID=404589 RepID=UPI0000ED8AC6|nr:permease [Anaeromyxobacter sp. Fw109-5]ABS27386.1 PGAP1 family protein [Anaeromyxobacter sp. Fw109-5]